MAHFRTGWGPPRHRGGWGWLGGLLPPIVKKLILINVAVFVLSFFLELLAPRLGVAFVRFFAVVPEQVAFRAHLWQLVTYMFLHGGAWHLLINMLVLWMFGSDLERDWGRRRFLTFYFLTGIGAGLFNVVVSLATGRGAAATIGASGAIYGILLAFGLLYPNRPILIIPFPVTIPAKIYVLVIGGITFLSSLGASGGISHITHLGGMLFGYLYLRGDWMYYRALYRYRDWRRRHLRRKFEVYMREHEGKDSQRPLDSAQGKPHDRWIH